MKTYRERRVCLVGAVLGMILSAPPMRAQWTCTGGSCSTSGAVGIGTSSAPFPLTLSTAADRVLNFRSDPASFGFPSTLGGPIIQSVNSAQSVEVPMTFSASSFSLMSGNVGIGTTAPDAPLVVSTSAWNTPAAYISTSISGGGLGLYSTNTNTAARNWGIVGNFINFGDFAIVQSAARAGNPFADATTPKFYMTASGNIGVGTVTPASKLHLLTAPGSNFADGITLQSASTSPGDGTSILWTDSAGAEKARVFQTAAGNSFRFESAGPIMFNTAITGPTGTNQRMVIDTSGNVGIGTTAPAHLLHVAGTIGAQEIIVSSTGADYVFDSGYQLRPLKDVAAYIQANRHLPGIPSAEEVKEKGMSVGEMEAKLLGKIEELTLHMIRAEEKNNQLEEQNRDLQQQNRAIREEIKALKGSIAR